jgi:hypothetical protein
MALTKEQRHADLHAQAMQEFDAIQTAQRNERLQSLQDRRFYSIAGAQWEGPLGEQFENRPKFEFNKVHLSVIRIINEYRNNRITVDFTTKDGQKDDKLADTCDGLYRADERACTADEAYDNAFEEGVGGGMGAWRLRACYEDEDDDENDAQRCVMEPIFDADSCVYFDLDAKRYDKADAKRCFVLTGMTHGAFEDQFGHNPTSWPKSVHQHEFDWTTPDLVYVAEYYRVEETTELLHIFRGLALNDGEPDEMTVKDSELKADPDKLPTLLATGFREVRQKRVKRKRVHKYILSGLQVEEDEGYIAGKHIPIVPFYGKRWVVDGVERCMGHVRLAKDAQRLSNSLLSWLGEMAGRFDIEKPIVTPEQIAGHTLEWAQDNIKKFPYLLLNPITDASGQQVAAGPIGYTKAPNIPPAMAALMQVAEQALQDLLGNQEAGEQMQPNLSGKAVELIQQRLDMQVFIYMSNFQKSMKRCGEIWLSMAKDILVEESRRMKTLDANGESGSVVINQPAVDLETGEDYLENNLTEATFDVDVDVGPSSSSQRSATVRALTGIASITDDPETKQALTLATIANLEGEGLSDLRDWARAKAIRAGVIKPTEEEKQQLTQEAANQQPDPQAQYLQAAAKKAEADTVQSLAGAKLKEAQAAKTQSEIGLGQHAHSLEAAKAIHAAATPPIPGI